MAGGDGHQLRLLHPAALLRKGAAGGETAPLRRVDEIRRVTLDRDQLEVGLLQVRVSVLQSERVRMDRLVEERPDVGNLDDLAGIHHRDPVTRFGDDADVAVSDGKLTPELRAKLDDAIEARVSQIEGVVA